ncbi:MAG: response regulator [Oscillospiraceae bacterium]|nr:response regulator [Oscillospiraceae bacterium]
MEKRKILIADTAEDFCGALEDALCGIYHIRTVADGPQALLQLRSFLPDILVLDLMLPGLDGITLLQKAAETGICPTVLATTRYISDYMLDAAGLLGVGYIMVKPCDISAVVSRIADLSQRLKPSAFAAPDARTLISNTLLRLGVSTKLRGYGYLRECILLMAQDPRQSVTKELYPAAAFRLGATAVQIERSIRSAVNTAWSRQDRNIWQLYFPADQTGLIPRPTNARFISRLADMLILNPEIIKEE